MLGGVAWAKWRRGNSDTWEGVLASARIVVAALYFWSGIHKINASFVFDVYPWLLEPLLKVLPPLLRQPLLTAGYAAPFVELAIGIGLLLRPTRRLAVAVAIAMHLGILLLLGPTGHNFNSVVWPWNLIMVALVLMLFWHAPAGSIISILWPRDCLYARLVLLLVGVLPGLNLLGLWDSYLSAALYSGTTLEARIEFTLEQRERLPVDIRRQLRRGDDKWELDLGVWSMNELNVPDYPARRVFLNVATKLAAELNDPEGVVLVIGERPDWATGHRRETDYTCGRSSSDATESPPK
jgi:hypothetical protein